jgi:hypothetical protein
MKDFLVTYFLIAFNKKAATLCLKWKHNRDSESLYAVPEVGIAECHPCRLETIFQRIDRSLNLNTVQLSLPHRCLKMIHLLYVS